MKSPKPGREYWETLLARPRWHFLIALACSTCVLPFFWIERLESVILIIFLGGIAVWGITFIDAGRRVDPTRKTWVGGIGVLFALQWWLLATIVDGRRSDGHPQQSLFKVVWKAFTDKPAPIEKPPVILGFVSKYDANRIDLKERLIVANTSEKAIVISSCYLRSKSGTPLALNVPVLAKPLESMELEIEGKNGRVTPADGDVIQLRCDGFVLAVELEIKR